MYHSGNEDIEIHNIRNTYEDANEIRYVIGSHDVFLRRGKVINKIRNVITIALGDIPEKSVDLTANLYGILGNNEDYHYIGYDITANRIYEQMLKFIDKYSNKEKVLFVTSIRSARGIANLLSKKLIDRFGTN